ncbi:hypothetical protein GCM10022245_29540 [Streptomyces mayteni]
MVIPATKEQAGCADLGHGAHPAEGKDPIGNPASTRAVAPGPQDTRERGARTGEYVVRRTAEGMGRRDITRCLKRFVAREIYRHLPRPRSTAGQLPRAA